jgi:4-alpha-glucanotransferase
MTALEDLAARYAIQRSYHSIDGREFRPPPETLKALLAAFGVPVGTEAEQQASLAAAPTAHAPELRAPGGVACHLPDWLERGRAWGLAVQLYQLRSARNWGVGDFADLAVLARMAAAEGADFVGLNPLHAPLVAEPARRSPFSPSSRRFLNPLYIAIDVLPGFDPASVPPEALAAVRAAPLVDYPAVARLKLDALRRLWQGGPGDAQAFEGFREAGGAALERHARFEAISARMAAEGRGAGWARWPEELQDPQSAGVADFAEHHADEVAFHAWLQWLADRQLGEARDAALAAGMRLGLYLDFAVGEIPDGSSTWSDRHVTVPGVHVGAPPDYFSATGQDWELAPLSPVAMAATDAAPFGALIDAATANAGALRIDHAMALWQLFLMPAGAPPAEGTYVRFPVGAMLTALAEASRANRTVMIGEDLGNVPPGFRDVMEAVRVLSYRILLFERDERGFLPPEAYPRSALVCLSTHDLPTFQGWWRGDDVALRAEHGLIDAQAAADQAAARDVERRNLLGDLAAAGLVTEDAARHAPRDAAPDAIVVAAHRHLARAPSRLFAVRLEDLVGEREPVNLPGTVDEYPNWRRKLPVELEALLDQPLWREIAAALRAERPQARLASTP